MQAIRELTRCPPSIINKSPSLDSHIIIEGINNKIKLIKRISFGYRNF
ncbi:transposase, partial [Staphylococcus aureus]|nr:transposase [Staphylococcus aureus]